MIVEHLIADTFGTHIGKYSERLKVTQGGDTLAQAPLLHLQSVLVTSRGVSISADALEACAERGIPVFFVDSQGHSYASLYASGLTGTVLTRRSQLLSYYDERGVNFALTIAAAKIHNQAATLKYMAKNRKESDPALYEELRLCAGEVLDWTAPLEKIQGQGIEDVRAHIMGIEGSAARRYWEAVRLVLPAAYGWTERHHRGAADPINSLLNYGYGILYGQIEQAIILAGLDPYAGFLHADRPGKPSLVLDLIEEFRQEAVDRVVFGLANRDYIVQQNEKGLLASETRRDFAEKVLNHLDASVRHDGKRYPLRFVIQMQARQLASFFRGDCAEYSPYRGTY
ncbi:MAG: CRISPR-associated endonuclease Cas1 [Anaerolineae bacterium]|nr:MAG: CRISPR-associated endonuclease Cas1 [Anaerolineae bacterium]